MQKYFKFILVIVLVVPIVLLWGFTFVDNDAEDDWPLERILALEIALGGDIENFLEDATKTFHEMMSDPKLSKQEKAELTKEFEKLKTDYEKARPNLELMIRHEEERAKKVYPKPAHKGVDIDKLMTKLKTNKNWVFVMHTTTDGMYDTTGFCLVNELNIIERNGNVMRKTRSMVMSDDDDYKRPEYTERHYTVFNGKGKGTAYYCRREHGEKNWIWQPQAGGEFEGTIESHFEKVLGWQTEPFKKLTVTRKIDENTYHFWGIEDKVQTAQELADILGHKRRKNERQWYMTHNYTLTFGTSTVQAPNQEI